MLCDCREIFLHTIWHIIVVLNDLGQNVLATLLNEKLLHSTSLRIMLEGVLIGILDANVRRMCLKPCDVKSRSRSAKSAPLH